MSITRKLVGTIKFNDRVSRNGAYYSLSGFEEYFDKGASDLTYFISNPTVSYFYVGTNMIGDLKSL